MPQEPLGPRQSYALKLQGDLNSEDLEEDVPGDGASSRVFGRSCCKNDSRVRGQLSHRHECTAARLPECLRRCHQQPGTVRCKPAPTIAASGFREHSVWSRLSACKKGQHRRVRNRHALEPHRTNRTAFALPLVTGDIGQQGLRSGKQHKSEYDELERSLHKLY